MFVMRREITTAAMAALTGRRASGRGNRKFSVGTRLRARLKTTPGRLWLISGLAVAAAVCFGVVATVSEAFRARAAQTVQTQTEPLLAQAVGLYTALSDANATATTTFLTGGLEPPARRVRYLQDVRLASDSLTALTRAITSPPAARTAVASIAEQLPRYSGLVESGRAGNRQGFPVGAAYMRAASGLLTATVLPAANQLFSTESARLSQGYSSGTASTALVVLGVVALLMLGLLVALQLHLTRITRRVFNVPVVLGSAVLAIVTVWAVIALINEQDALATARGQGSDSVQVVSAARVLFSRAQTDQSLTLVSRGSDQTDPLDFAKVMQVLSPPGGLLGQIATLNQLTGTPGAGARLSSDFEAYRMQAAQIAALQQHGQTIDAAQLASSPGAAAVENRLTSDLVGQANTAQARFERAASDASSSLSGLSIAIPVLTVLAALLAMGGLQQRLGEYR
jgi:hypothetical protein